ncbi:MAG: hypothetical protein SGILL_003023 [Bacillariaceae sp.]
MKRLNAAGIVSLLVTTQDDGAIVAKECDFFSLNLSLAFLTLSIPRSEAEELEKILPGLLVVHAAYEQRVDQRKQWNQVSHLLLAALERIIVQEEAAMKQQRANSRNNTATKRMNSTVEEKKQTQPMEIDSPPKVFGLEHARQIISKDAAIAASTYDLILDALLYTTQAGNVPPGGLSSIGWERLKDGHSSTEKDWAAEMAPLNRLALLKTRLIEWVAPSRRWGLFLGQRRGGVADSKRDNGDNSNDNGSTPPSEYGLGIARTVALLVVASGDSMQSVAEAAKQYLKQYFDEKKSTGGFGDADRLCKELLSLSVGKINASMALATPDNTTCSEDSNGLGRFHANVSFQRRQVPESHYAELVGMSTRAFDETSDGCMVDVGKLVILSSDKMLSKLTNAVGLNNQRGKPFVTAAEQLSSLVVRLERCPTLDMTIFSLHSRSLALAVKVLNPIAAAKVTSSSNAVSESHVSVRDSVYGSISTLSRSSFATEKFFCLMAGGNLEAPSLSMDLIHLLFRCVGNEVDRLRPRATAALDAVLFACRRATEVPEPVPPRVLDPVHANPWATTANQQNDAASSFSELPQQLARSTLPLLWGASRPAQPRQSRVAASRWASDLLMSIDVVNATHILCFLAGDSDVTAAAIARDGLGLSKEKNAAVADFGEICEVILSGGDTHSRPTYWDFSPQGKTASLRCLLRSFLDDFHGEGSALRSFMQVVTETLLTDMNDKDLQDTCSESILICVAASSDARTMIASGLLPLGVEILRNLAFSASSSMARRFLAEAFGKIMEDPDELESLDWQSILKQTSGTALNYLTTQPLKPCSETHGAALLGGTIVNIVRKHSSLVTSDVLMESTQVLINLGEGIMHRDDTVGNVCADGILLAFSKDVSVGLPERYVGLPFVKGSCFGVSSSHSILVTV